MVRPARLVRFQFALIWRFELISLSGAQSVNIVNLLIIIERPSPKFVRAIEATAAWLESALIEGRRVIEHPEDNRQGKNWMAFHKLTFASYCWTKDVIRRYGRGWEKLMGRLDYCCWRLRESEPWGTEELRATPIACR